MTGIGATETMQARPAAGESASGNCTLRAKIV